METHSPQTLLPAFQHHLGGLARARRLELSLEVSGLLLAASFCALHVYWSQPFIAVFGAVSLCFLAVSVARRHRQRSMDSAGLLRGLDATLDRELQGLFSAAFAAEQGAAAGSAPLLQAVREQALPLLPSRLKLVQCPARPRVLAASLPLTLVLAFWPLPATPSTPTTAALPSEAAWSRLSRSAEVPRGASPLSAGTGGEAPLSSTQTSGGTTGEANKEAQRGEAGGSAGASGSATGSSLEPGAGSSAGGASSPTATSTPGDACPPSS